MRVLIPILAFTLGLSALTAEAKVVDLTPLQTSVKDQKNRDTCAYFAVNGLTESLFKGLTGQDYDLSEEYEIFHHKIVNAWRPEVEFGNTYDLVLNFSHRYFAYDESLLPYQKESPDFTKGLSPDQTAFYDLRKQSVPRIEFRSLKPKMLTQMWVRKPWSALVMQELDQQRPVVITLKVSLSHINDKTGEFTYNSDIDAQCNSGALKCGGHAVLIVGYDDEAQVFKFKNSWSDKWGYKGYGRISFEHADKFSDQPMTAYFDKLSGPLVKVREP